MPTKPRPWTDHDTDRLRELHGQGKTLTAIARELDRSKYLISTKAKDAGLSWDRSRTAAATHARTVDARARRAAIKDRLYGRAEAILDRLEAETFDTLVMSAGSQEHRNLTFVPPQDERHLSSSASTYLAAAERLEKLDADAGTQQAVGMLDAVMAAIRDHVAQQQ